MQDVIGDNCPDVMFRTIWRCGMSAKVIREVDRGMDSATPPGIGRPPRSKRATLNRGSRRCCVWHAASGWRSNRRKG